VTPEAEREFAPAKVNLALCVTGRRSDGYHNLDSLVVFADLGDSVEARAGPALSLDITGPCAAGVPVEGNLVLRAAEALREAAGRRTPGARLMLEKVLPAAAGIGGGSSDAAAALRALNRLWAAGLSLQELMFIGAKIGADVPICVFAGSARIRGIGEIVTPIADLPRLHLVLANPGCRLATAAVFARLTRTENPGLPEPLEAFADIAALVSNLKASRNDLEPLAIEAEPQIAEVLAALSGLPDCLLSRMSGSGATCFGLFPDAGAATRAARQLSALYPAWWVAPAKTL
jgi:4-diphosphocytidyl-2-C-methyl-D-erythritol kinase